MKKTLVFLLGCVMTVAVWAQGGDMSKFAPKLAVGTAAPEIVLPRFDGEERVNVEGGMKPTERGVKLSDFLGRYVLVDFWATWCGDCRREMPIMREALEAYKGKIDVLSVSFDNKREALANYLEKHPMDWPVVADFSPWKESAVTKAYELNWIPTFYIIDPEGKIAGGGITGEQLKSELQRIFGGYSLVWSDEFETDGRLAEHWSFEQGFVRNEELQWYQPQNAWVENGCLVIEGRRETVPNPNYKEGSRDWRRNRRQAEYTSACVISRGKFEFKYGRLEVRAKIPVSGGAWPAIWTLGNRWPWPDNGEVDLLEHYLVDGRQTILANAAWGDSRQWTAVWSTTHTPLTHFTERDPLWVEKFHVWRMDWDEKFIRLYLDDELLNEVDLSKTQNRGNGGNHENPFSNDIPGFGQYVLLNLALGGNGGTIDDSAFPLRMEVDYVRYYKPDK